ncbi:ROK family protein [Micromonospora endolithica]|uniref:ROK family protein n=1 Tax=Micromonospora endolithica TaxID=230091 RepID=A0A3A9YXM8_9ACTN|nr:ROK family protein [Micromonospora endolithica]RKN40569.1 ROK family protein [Micromonospora endolithica]TWJ21646.1 glucokinase [Micromonospora endolithica]
MTTPILAAVDIGGTKTAAALVRGGTVLARTQAPTPASGAAAVLDTAAALVRSLGGAPAAVGVGAPGLVDPDTGLVNAASSLIHGWSGVDVRAGLRDRLRLPAVVLGDVQAFTLGEAVHGAGRGLPTVLGVAVGTGVGGGVHAAGRLLTGRLGAAGHVGHVPVPQAVGRPCPCGVSGHVEAVASGPAMAAGYAARTGALGVALPEVVRRARAGDEYARAVIATAGEALGTALAGLANVLDPDRIVVGGGAAVPELLDALRPAFAASCLPVLGAVPLVPAALGTDAPLVGAAEAARRALASGAPGSPARPAAAPTGYAGTDVDPAVAR